MAHKTGMKFSSAYVVEFRVLLLSFLSLRNFRVNFRVLSPQSQLRSSGPFLICQARDSIRGLNTGILELRSASHILYLLPFWNFYFKIRYVQYKNLFISFYSLSLQWSEGQRTDPLLKNSDR